MLFQENRSFDHYFGTFPGAHGLFSGGRLDAGLTGAQPPLPPAYATIPAARVKSLPHCGGQGCRTLNITPTDYRNGTPVDPPPADFNPRPTQNPGTPTSGTFTP